MQTGDTKKNSILKKFKKRVIDEVWAEGEKIFEEGRIENILSSQKENSNIVYIQGEVLENKKIYTPSFYYDLDKNYVEVFTCNCPMEEKGPCRHVAGLFISVINKFYLKEKNTLELKILNSNRIISIFKNFINENNIFAVSTVEFKIEIREDEKIFLTNFLVQNKEFWQSFKIIKLFTEFSNSPFEKEGFVKFLEKKSQVRLDGRSKIFLNIIEGYLKCCPDKIGEKDELEISEFFLPAVFPYFSYLCKNYISKAKEPEIFISSEENFIVFEIKNIENWKTLKKDYMYFQSSDKFIKIISAPEHEKGKKLLEKFSQNSKLIFFENEINFGMVTAVLQKFIKITVSEEIKSKYYIPKNIEYGILIQGVNKGISITPKIVYDGKTEEEIEKIIVSDKSMESEILKKNENFLRKNYFKKIEGNYYMFCENHKIFEFMSERILKTPKDFHVIFHENMKDARVVFGTIFVKTFKEKDKIKIKITSDNFTKEETAEILGKHSSKRYLQLRNNTLAMVENQDILSLRLKMFSINADYEERKQGEFYRPNVFDFFMNNITFNSMNMKNYLGSFSPKNFSLRKYQKYGINWLLNMKEKNWGGVLADGAMLGKKVQILTFLYIQSKTSKLPNLILVWDNLEILKWEREIRKFYEDMNYRIIDKVLDKEMEFFGFSEGETLITTYELHKKNFGFYKKIKFENIILSNGDMLKELPEPCFKILLRTKKNTAYALADISVEFLYPDIWWIFSAAVPDYFPLLEEFREKYTGNERKTIKEFTAHLILRRTKREVEKQLLSETREDIFFNLEPKQKRIYDALCMQSKNYFENNKRVRGNEIREAFYELKNTALYRLNTILDSPKEEISEKERKFFRLLDRLYKNELKIVVFTEYPLALQTEKKYYDKSISISFIKENAEAERIEKVFNRFNEDKQNVLIISSKINLSDFKILNVDAVIYFDPWHFENHRRYIENFNMKSIQIYNFYALGTVEEKVYNLKKSLSKEKIFEISKLPDKEILKLI